jgi:hypothetical protein
MTIVLTLGAWVGALLLLVVGTFLGLVAGLATLVAVAGLPFTIISIIAGLHLDEVENLSASEWRVGVDYNISISSR